MNFLAFQSFRLSSAQWIRLGQLIHQYRVTHRMKQPEFAARLNTEVARAAAELGIPVVGMRYDHVDISRVERLRNWTVEALGRIKRVRYPSLRKTYQLQGMARVLGIRLEDLLSEPGSPEMQQFTLSGPEASVQLLNTTLQKHEETASHAIVWSKTLISMFFPEEALAVYYRQNYADPTLSDKWVASTIERRDAVLGRAATRRWAFTHVLFSSDLQDVVRGTGRFANMDLQLRAACLEGVARAVSTTRACEVAIVDDLSPDHDPVIDALKTEVGVYTHLSNMGRTCVLLNDVFGTWHIGESRQDIRLFHGILDDMLGWARYRDPQVLLPYLGDLMRQMETEPPPDPTPPPT